MSSNFDPIKEGAALVSGFDPESEGATLINTPESIPSLQNSQVPQPPQTWGNYIGNSFKGAGQDVLAGLGKLGHGLINAPYQLLPQSVINKLPSSFQPQPNYDFSAMVGKPNPGLQDQLIQNAIQYSPYAIGAGGLAGTAAPWTARAAAQGLGGLAYGATQTPNPSTGAITNALTGAATEGLGSGIANTLAIPASGIKNYLSQFASPGMFNNIKDFLNFNKETNNQSAFNAALKNHDENIVPDEQNKWNVAKGYGQTADYTSGVSFDDSSYKEAMNKHIQDLQDKLKHNPDSQDLKDSITLANNFLNAPHGSFQGAMDHMQALNRSYNDTVTPGVSAPATTVKYAISQFKKTVNDNIQDNNLQPLKDAFDSANQATANKNQIFNQVVSSKGKTVPSNFLNFRQNNNENADQSTFVSDYIPNKNQGIQKFQQFGQMLGDENFGKNVLKQNIFGDVDNAPKFLKKYNSLSDSQQKYLFDSDQMSQINALQSILQKNKNALTGGQVTGFIKHALPTLLGASAGGAAAHGAGMSALLPEIGGAATALGLSNIARPAMNWAFSKNPINKYFVNSLNNPVKQSLLQRLNLNINPLSTATVPATNNAIGNYNHFEGINPLIRSDGTIIRPGSNGLNQ